MAQGSQRGEGARHFLMDYKDVDGLIKLINDFPVVAQKTINEVLHADIAVDMVENNIIPLIPSSNRHWKGKKAAASSTQPFRKGTNKLLTLTVRSKTIYNYLYFSDDGTNTINHAGEKHFMQRGADGSTSAIADLCVKSVLEEWNNTIR